MSPFLPMLTRSWAEQRSLLCVGLDPQLDKLPPALRTDPARFFAFGRAIVDATAPWVCAFKLQIAHYAACGAESQLQRTIAYIKREYPHLPVILDAKRGDIGSTAAMYAREAFERYGADAVTVNPYLGGDSLAPFLEYTERGVFILCRTSNPGSAELQGLESGGVPVAHHVARRAATEWNRAGNVGLVVGATWPDEVGAVRALVGDMPLLVPAIGAQGGVLGAVLARGLNQHGTGLLLSVSRSVIYAAAGGEDFAAAAAAAAEALCREINRLRTPANAPT